MSTNLDLLAALAPAAQERAAAEAREWRVMLAYRDAEHARIAASGETPMRQYVERAGLAIEIAMHCNLSVRQVEHRLSLAERIRDDAPQVWAAFGHGVIDAARAREIAGALAKLERPESRARLNEVAVAYACTHTVAETRQWLRRFVTRIEADLAIERANAERTKRHVEVTAVEDGMAWLNAYLPAHEAAAVATRLRRSARAARAAGDDRTRAQLEADLLTQWALTAEPSREARESGLRIDIGVTIDAPALAGAVNGHAEAVDGSWEVPTKWLLDSALAGNAFWHRILRDPFTGNTLAHHYDGYHPPDVLRRAIILRDGVCAGHGCLRPAAECDLDHRQPWPQGPTSGDNLDPRCRRDHAVKGHGVWDDILARYQAVQAQRPAA